MKLITEMIFVWNENLNLNLYLGGRVGGEEKVCGAPIINDLEGAGEHLPKEDEEQVSDILLSDIDLNSNLKPNT